METKTILSRFKTFFLLLSLTAAFAGCSDDDSFSLTDPFLMMKYDYFVTFDPGDGIYILVHKPVTDGTLSINDTIIPLTWHNASYGNTISYYSEVSVNNLPPGVSFNPADSVIYHLVINGKAFSGRIALPSLPTVNWSEFNPSEDYPFEWTIITPAQTQLVDASVDDEENDNERTWDIGPDARAYTVKKSFWKGFDFSDMWFDVSLIEVNYHHSGEFLLLAYTENDYEWEGKFFNTRSMPGRSIHTWMQYFNRF